MKNILIISFFFLLLSCNKQTETAVYGIYIYKYTNPDYRYLAYIQLSNDKSHIAGKIYEQDTLYIGSKELQNNYILDSGIYIINDGDLIAMEGYSSVGMETAISSISRLDYERYNMSFDSISNNILDKDPFEEYYYRTIDTFQKNPDLYNHLDEYIVNDQLESKLGFIRLK